MLTGTEVDNLVVCLSNDSSTFLVGRTVQVLVLVLTSAIPAVATAVVGMVPAVLVVLVVVIVNNSAYKQIRIVSSSNSNSMKNPEQFVAHFFRCQPIYVRRESALSAVVVVAVAVVSSSSSSSSRSSGYWAVGSRQWWWCRSYSCCLIFTHAPFAATVAPAMRSIFHTKLQLPRCVSTVFLALRGTSLLQRYFQLAIQ